MKKNIISLFTQYKEISMTPEEKEIAWGGVLTRTFESSQPIIEAPVRKLIPSRLYSRVLQPIVSYQNVFFKKKKYAFAVVSSLLIVSGGISAFAQGALPGDFFYAVKTDVNEKIQVAMALTPQKKALLEATLATKRIEEAEKLALNGKLNPVIANQTGEAFDTHVRKLETYIAELGDKADYSAVEKVGVFFQTRIAVHVAVLKDMSVDSKILSSSLVTDKLPDNTSDPRTINYLEYKVLTDVIPTIIATKKAVANISSSQEDNTNSNKDNNQHAVSLNIDSEQAKDYLIELHENVGTPASIMKVPTSSVVPVFVPQQ